jgi:hypothetical protein
MGSAAASPYAYCSNDPVNYIDPSGMTCLPMPIYIGDLGGGDVVTNCGGYGRAANFRDASGSTNVFKTDFYTQKNYKNGQLIGVEIFIWDEELQGYDRFRKYDVVARYNRKDLKGNVMTTKGNGFLSWIVALATGSSTTHASMIVENSDGVIGTEDAYYGKNMSINAMDEWIDGDATDMFSFNGDKSVALDYAKISLGAPYNTKGAIGFGANGLSGSLNNPGLYCSQFVGQAFGIKNPSIWQNPGTLNSYLSSSSDWTQLW